MSLVFGQSPFLLALCVLGAAGLTWWAYRTTTPALAPARRLVLAALRFLALFLVLFLLFEPIVRTVVRDERAPTLAIIVDDSQSLSLASEPGEEPPFSLSDTVRQVLAQVPTGNVDGAVRVFRFGGDLAPLPGADSLQFDAARTNIARAINEVRETLRDDNLRGILLVSDGRYNTGRNPLYLAERSPVPIHTLVVGDTTSRRDLQVRRVTTNEIAYVGTTLPLRVGLRSVDYGGETVTVSLLQGDTVLTSTTATLGAGTAEVPVDLDFEPQASGLARLTVAVTRLPGEATYRNNRQTVTVRVLESKRSVLLVGAAPNPDLAALRTFLDEDPNVEVTSRVQKQQGLFYEGAFPDDVGRFDLILLAGYPSRVATLEILQQIAEAAEAGTPLLFLYSQQTDLNLLERTLGEVLPVTPEEVRQTVQEASLLVTPTGEQHPILDIPSVPGAARRALPPLLQSESRWTVSPDARVLATSQVRGIALDDPLLVVRRRGPSRAAVLLGGGTWRWANLPADLEAAEPFWPALFSNLLRWITTREDDRPVRVEPIETTFAGGERAEFTGQVYDESLNPVDGAAVRVEVTGPDGAQYPYSMENVGNGRYTLDAGVLPEGAYTYTASAQRGGTELGTDRGSFAVGALTLEFRETQADAALMRQIAERSGGTFLEADRVEALPDYLAGSDAFQPVVYEEERSVELWHRYAFLIAIIVLLTAEWFLRKRSGMV